MASAPPPPSNPQFAEPPPPYGVHDPSKSMYPNVPPQATYGSQPNYSGVPPPPPIVAQPGQVQTVIVQTVGYGPNPVSTHCPKCSQPVVSSVRYDSGLLTWLIFGALCFFGCWFGCCLIPFCIDSCKDVRHVCPNCRATLGYFRRL